MYRNTNKNLLELFRGDAVCHIKDTYNNHKANYTTYQIISRNAIVNKNKSLNEIKNIYEKIINNKLYLHLINRGNRFE